MLSILDVLSLSTNYLKERNITYPRRQAENLLCDTLGLSRLQLYLDFERPLNEQELKYCRENLKRHSQGEPLAYIHGQVDFYSCSLLVTPAVLIPRQETEILIDKIVSFLDKKDLKGKSLWDVCCGSGCMGIALKKRFPELEITLSDLSSDALQVAAQNAERNNVKVNLLEGDLLIPFIGQKTHFFVCNPPYIAEHEYMSLDQEVQAYEPRLALVGGQKGIEFYERLATCLPAYLHPHSALWFEIGYQQGETVQTLFQGKPWCHQRIEKDWAGHDRFFFLENE